MDQKRYFQMIDIYLSKISNDASLMRKISSIDILVKINIQEFKPELCIAAGKKNLKDHSKIIRWNWGDLNVFQAQATLFAQEKTSHQLLAGKLNLFLAMAQGELKIKGRKKTAIDLFKIINSARNHYAASLQ